MNKAGNAEKAARKCKKCVYSTLKITRLHDYQVGWHTCLRNSRGAQKFVDFFSRLRFSGADWLSSKLRSRGTSVTPRIPVTKMLLWYWILLISKHGCIRVICFSYPRSSFYIRRHYFLANLRMRLLIIGTNIILSRVKVDGRAPNKVALWLEFFVCFFFAI